MHWFTLPWWQYLLAKPCNWEMFWCRMSGHKEGPWFFNVGGTEPDWRCRGCDDNLG